MMFTTEELKKMTPAQYAEACNAATKARALSEGWQCYMTLPTDEEYFENAGWETAYDYALSMARSELSDLFKSLNGFRPRSIYDWEAMDLDAVNAEIASLMDDVNAEAEREERLEREDREAHENAMKAEPLTHSPFAGLSALLG